MKAWPSFEEARWFLWHGTGRGIKVAILDSGVELTHPRLQGLRLADDVAFAQDGLRMATADGAGADVFGHGTAIADIIRRMAPEAQLGSFRVLGDNLRSRSLMIRAGAREAMNRGYHILNCSFGCSREDHLPMHKEWVDEAYNRRHHLVAACNNQDWIRPEWPGHFPTVITVNFTECEDPAVFFSRSGRLVEFAARGQNIEVAWRGGVTKRVTGSSFAAPHMSGLLARLLSGCPELSPLEAKAMLLRLAAPGPDLPAGAPE